MYTDIEQQLQAKYEESKRLCEELTAEYHRLVSEIMKHDPQIALREISRFQTEIKNDRLQWESDVRKLGLEKKINLS